MVDTVVINSQPPTEDPKHVEEMIKKVDEANAPPADENTPQDPPQEDRPGWLPEKFKSPEDLAKAYDELQKKLGQPTENKTTEQNKSAEDQNKQVEQELADRGLDFTEFSNEFANRGELTAESYEKLEKAGIPRNYVDQYIEGQKARVALYESEVKSVAGGDKGFSEMVEWATANLSPQEISAYNAAIDSGVPDQAKLAVAGVYQKFSSARPQEPSLVKGQTSGSVTGESYESIAQLTKDMASPEYKNDPAFRSKVQQKLSRSTIL
jgi:hypothetical protein